MTDPSALPTLAYITGLYPKVSHTFIQREVMSLRNLGFEVMTCSVRKAPALTTIGPDQLAEASTTFVVLDAAQNPLRLIAAHLGQILRNPKRWLSSLRLAVKTRSPGIKSLVWQFFYFAEAGILADEALRRKIEHFHNHFGDSSGTLTMLAAEMAGLSYSITLHGPTVFLEADRWRLDEKIARASFVACISHFCRSQAMLFSDERHWHKLQIVHCGIRPEMYGASPVTGKHIVFVGRLAPAKGLSLLIDAFSDIVKLHPTAKLTLAGDGPMRERLSRKCVELGLESRVSFLGFIDEQQVSLLLQDADLLVLPSFAEGLPVVLMEAMATGLPVIASRIAGIPELVRDGENGILIPAGDTTELIQAMDRLLSDPALRYRMGQAGRESVLADFTIEAEARRLARLFSASVTSA